jgi:hypothetical protein
MHEAKRGKIMQNEAFAERVLGRIYIDLVYALRRTGDMRQPEEIVALAVKLWMAERLGNPEGKGYQWKDLFLPDGTDLRLRYKGVDYHARVDGDRIMYAGGAVSPRAWCMMVTGSSRNAWREVWIRRSVNEYWTRARTWRKDNSVKPALPFGERRQLHRRLCD